MLITFKDQSFCIVYTVSINFHLKIKLIVYNINLHLKITKCLLFQNLFWEHQSRVQLQITHFIKQYR